MFFGVESSLNSVSIQLHNIQLPKPDICWRMNWTPANSVSVHGLYRELSQRYLQWNMATVAQIKHFQSDDIKKFRMLFYLRKLSIRTERAKGAI